MGAGSGADRLHFKCPQILPLSQTKESLIDKFEVRRTQSSCIKMPILYENIGCEVGFRVQNTKVYVYCLVGGGQLRRSLFNSPRKKFGFSRENIMNPSLT